MTKTELANGMSLVDIPEAGLSVLCGCPENAVKFLKKSGIIREVEVGGCFETGPNAILLSELPVQGGRFRNVGEFPVLQMLYRQGMIIPGHPSNTGLRPMIIGVRDQVEAQSRYIYSGNYGLSTLEELESGGLGPEEAREQLRMKLKFAFGSIRGTEELLDLRVFDGHAIELRGGAFVRRLEANRYEFLHSGQALEVCLDASPGHELPYELPRGQVEGADFSVVHIGEGDGWDPERPCMASLIQYRGGIYLIDAGPDIEASLAALGLGINDVKGLFQTHAHDDHFVGLTALLRSERRIAYYAVPWVRASVEAKLRALSGIGSREFRRYFEVKDLEEGRWNDLDGLEVLPTMSPHPVETTVFTFRARGGVAWRSYAHLADLASFSVLDSMVEADPSLPGITAGLAARTKAAYLLPVDVKKVDAGGGMIHGSAGDFAGDESGLVLLSHGSPPAAAEAAPRARIARFGEQQVLIPSRGPGGAAPAGEPASALAGPSPQGAAVAGAAATAQALSILSTCRLFEGLSGSLLAELAGAAALESVQTGQGLCGVGASSLCLVVEGRARVSASGRRVFDLGPGEAFGEESLLIEGCCLFEARTLEPSQVCLLPYASIEELPLLLWRLRETLEGRFAAVKSGFDFSWRPSFSVGEEELDAQHRKLFGLIAGLDAAVRSPESCADAASLMDGLVEFAALHFGTEEGYMRRGLCPELAAHAREHESTLRDLEAYRGRYACGDEEALADLDGFLKDWVLKHTLLVDRQYMPYLPAALASRSPAR